MLLFELLKIRKFTTTENLTPQDLKRFKNQLENPHHQHFMARTAFRDDDEEYISKSTSSKFVLETRRRFVKTSSIAVKNLGEV
jgi:hypothetical protein